MKRLMTLMMVLCCLLSAASAEAFPTAPAQQEEASTTITAVGSASINAPRDMAVLSLTLIAESETASGAQQRMMELRETLRNSLQELNVTDIEETGYQLASVNDYEYGAFRSGEVIVGYSACAEVVVRFTDMNNVGAVVDATILPEGESVDHSLVFESSMMEAAHQEALALAVQEAMNNAEAIARACGNTLGQLVNVREISDGYREARVEVTYTVE